MQVPVTDSLKVAVIKPSPITKFSVVSFGNSFSVAVKVIFPFLMAAYEPS